MNIINDIIDAYEGFKAQHNFQDAGKIPILSTGSGLLRIARGFARIFNKNFDVKFHEEGIYNSGKELYIRTEEVFRSYIRINSNEYTREGMSVNGKTYSRFWNGAKDIVRGLVEMIPIIGNVAITIFDEKMAGKPYKL